MVQPSFTGYGICRRGTKLHQIVRLEQVVLACICYHHTLFFRCNTPMLSEASMKYWWSPINCPPLFDLSVTQSGELYFKATYYNYVTLYYSCTLQLEYNSTLTLKTPGFEIYPAKWEIENKNQLIFCALP